MTLVPQVGHLRVRRAGAVAGAILAAGLTLASCASGPEKPSGPDRLPGPVAAAPDSGDWRVQHANQEAEREAVRFADLPLPRDWSRVAVQTVPVPLNAPELEDGRGALTYRGGVEIRSDAARLHGLSDLVFTGPGVFQAISDEGLRIHGHVRLDEAGRLIGVEDVQLRPLVDGRGDPVLAKVWADAEGMTRLPDGTLLVSFERHHRIWHYPADGGQMLGEMAVPDHLFSENEGMEGITGDAAGGYWAAGENGGLWHCGSGACTAVQPVPQVAPDDADLRTVSLALDPTNPQRLFRLERAYDAAVGGNTVRLSWLPVDAGTDGHAARAGEAVILGLLARPATVDNFEGLAVVRRPDGGLRLYILSDDNFNARQRTLLLAFDLN